MELSLRSAASCLVCFGISSVLKIQNFLPNMRCLNLLTGFWAPPCGVLTSVWREGKLAGSSGFEIALVLLVSQRFNWIEISCADGWDHSADEACEHQDYCGYNH